jgi:amino acid adenylation domain-containing protein
LTGGDKLKNYKQKDYQLYNNYGPTENTVVSTSFCVTEASGNIPIGKPIFNTRIYIVNRYGHLQPIGIPGELYIEGESLALGYLNNPELTTEKFIEPHTSMHPCNHATMHPNTPSPHSPHLPHSPYSPIYLTGDLARWLPDGNIEFLGRIDHQVKIRGFRIEPGEIENCLLKVGGVKDVVVLVQEEDSGDKYICAYFVSDGEYAAPVLQEYLSRELPDYMIPSYFVQIEKIPLTINGKIDRRALPGPELKVNESFTAPGNEIEKKLIVLWAEILARDESHVHQLQTSIGIDDNFFQLGGHSLKAMTLVSRMQKVFDVNVPLVEIFKMSRVKELAQYIKGKDKGAYISIESAEEKEYYLLSSAQKRIYILQEMSLDNTAYNMPEVIPLPAGYDFGKIEETFKKLIKRHESLRTSFHLVNDTPVQVVHDEVEFDLELHDFQDSHDSQDFAERFVRPFTLAKAPLIRAGLIKEENKHYTLILDMHHIISDGLSHEILVKDFLSLYEGEGLIPLRIQYKDFTQWQNGEKEKENVKLQEGYWLKEFEGEIPVLELPFDYPRPVEQSFEGSIVYFELKEEETRALNAVALSEGSTLFMVLMAIYNILLSKLSGQEDIVIGTPIAGRRHADLDKIIGMFINTLCLRNTPTGNRKFTDFLADVKERTLMAFENQGYPFEELVDKLAVKRDIGRNPLFDVMFILQNMNTGFEGQDEETETAASQPAQADLPGGYENIFRTSRFDLTLTAIELGQQLYLSFEYCTKLFKKETVERISGYFKKIVSIAVKEPGIRLSEIEVIPGEEKKRLLFDFNDTRTEYQRDKKIHLLFERQVERTPGNIAVIGPSLSAGENHLSSFENATPAHMFIQVSYSELDEKANRLAHLLKTKGVGTETIVGLLVERSVEMMVGILGILKSGAAYLPIDPEYPEDRVNYMLKCSGAKVRVTASTFVNQDKMLRSDEEKRDFSSSHSANMAYTIYTSGSTGKPKGVVIDHRPVINFIKGVTDIIPHTVKDRVLSLTTISFDIFGLETLAPLIAGASVVMGSKEEQLNPEAAGNVIARESISILQVTPSRLKMILDIPEAAVNLKILKFLMVGGEAFPEPILERVRPLVSGRIFNMYGPTETTIWSAVKELSAGEELNIGKPIANTRIYIVDRSGKLHPMGVVGELCIGGDGLARGYLNRPEVTADKFVNDQCLMTNDRPDKLSPHSPHLPHSTYSPIYRTGDLARWLPDGNLEFLGRIDYQVKIRGFRIELGEIENRLSKHPGIKELVITDRTEEDGDKYLCAYIVSDKEYPASELREYLSRELPDYMIPSHFVRIEKIPLTPNGKVNRGALPKPELKVGDNFAPPRNEIEKKLAALWWDILGRDQLQAIQLHASIGINDNFFELGGHSLKATILLSRIHKEMSVKLPLAAFFKTPTIRGLSESIKGLTKNEFESIYPVEEKEYYEASSAQRRLYSFHQMDEKSTKFNMSTAIRLEGPFIKNKVEDAFKKLIKRHESFRTSFEMIENVPVRFTHDTVDFKVEYWELHTEHEEESVDGITRKFFRYFDLSLPPLLRVGLIKLAEEEHLLLLDTHHIISDGLSVEITGNEFLVLYTGGELPGMKLQYKDFSEWQQRLFETGEMKKQEEYWLNRFKGDIPTLNMPMDYDWPSVYRAYGSRLSFTVDREMTASLKQLVLETGVTFYIMLLAVYNILLSKYSRQEDIVIGSPIAGRRHVDLENMIGLFVNMLALRNRPAKDKSFIEFLMEVKTDTLEAFENQDFQFENLVWKLGIKAEYNRNPLFNAVFVMQSTGTSPANVQNKDELSKTRVLPHEVELERVHHELLLTVSEGNELYLEFQYATELFKESTIRRLSEHCVEILKQVVENRNVKLEDIILSHDLLAANTEVTKESEISFGF